MRLWSLHPKYLDSQGLVALWREALLAQAVLAGATHGYKHHPQLTRFQESSAPCKVIAAYLRALHAEAVQRGYRFDAGKIGKGGAFDALTVTRGQLDYERAHLARKLKVRAPRLYREFIALERIEPHPLFRAVRGGVAAWEVAAKLAKAP